MAKWELRADGRFHRAASTISQTLIEACDENGEVSRRLQSMLFRLEMAGFEYRVEALEVDHNQAGAFLSARIVTTDGNQSRYRMPLAMLLRLSTRVEE